MTGTGATMAPDPAVAHGSHNRHGRHGQRAAAIAALSLLGLAPAAPVEAQPSSTTVYRIVIVSYPTVPTTPPPAPWLEAFRDALRELGWVDGQNITIERRSAELDQITQLAAQVVRERFDLVMTIATPMARAMKEATSAIPIVMAVAADPIGGGVVDHLARPGANVTGHSIIGPELAGKRIELLKEVVPGLTAVALGLPAGRRSEPIVRQYIDEYGAGARRLGLKFEIAEVAGAKRWDAVFARLKRQGVGAVAIPEGRTLQTQARQVAAAAIRHRLPTIHALRQDVETGGLMSYGVDVVDLWRRSAVFVDKILRGARPGDLPIEQPTRFELVINTRTAKALGLDIPPAVLLRAAAIVE